MLAKRQWMQSPSPLALRLSPLVLRPSPHAPRDRGDERVGRSLSPTELVSRAPGRSHSARAWSSDAQRRSHSARAWSSGAQRRSLSRTGLVPGCTAPVALTQGAALLIPGNATSRVLIGETRTRLGHAERVTGIEPALSAWEAEVLPLNYTRVRVRGACALEAGTSGTPRRPGERRPAYLLSPGRANRRGPGRATAMPRAEPTATHEPRPAPHRPDAAAPYRTGPPVAPGGGQLGWAPCC